MCASLQRLNQQPESEDTGQSGHAALPPWVKGSGQFPGTDNRGGIFAVPAGPAPTEIPGFPFPPGTAPTTASVPAPQANGQNGLRQGGGIQPLPGMSIAARQAAAAAAVPQSPTGRAADGTPNVHSHGFGLSAIPGSVLEPPQPTAPVQSPGQGHITGPNGFTFGGQQGTAAKLSVSMINGVPTDQLSTGYLDPYDAWFPEPRNMAETGIGQGLITDLVIKTMYFTSYLSGQEISAALRLPFYGVIDQVTNLMKKEQLCDVSGASGLGEAGYQYILTVKGMERAHQVLQRSSYVGPAPVPLAKYIEAIKLESSNKPSVTKDTVERALKGMIMGEDLMNQVGAAVNAGKSLFLFGAPGNGKTLLAERIATMLGGSIAIPYALEADGQIIQLFDLNSHQPAVPKGADPTDSTKAELHDRRWVRVHRPVVTVGGELTMSSLDLVYNEAAGFYEAPFQLKANGGLFLIDDFGRQQMSPQALLNRWIVPLEKGIDYLTLKTGKKLQVPFELFLVLSTNLQPEDLVDDAFLRRIQNKLFVPDPSMQHFYEIFVGQCKSMSVPFDQHGFAHLVNKHYKETGRPFRASHPRDLLRQLLGLAKYMNVPPEITPHLLDAACATYFVNSKKK